MRFIKGMIVGGMIAVGTAMVCADGMCESKKRMIKKGRQFAKRMGIM